jgi:hypothetical protein
MCDFCEDCSRCGRHLAPGHQCQPEDSRAERSRLAYLRGEKQDTHYEAPKSTGPHNLSPQSLASLARALEQVAKALKGEL